MDFEMTNVSTTNSPLKKNLFTYNQKNVKQWFEEMDEIVNTEHIQLSNEQCPIIDVNDKETICKLREHINARRQKHNVYISTIKDSASSITTKLIERLCVADMDSLKVEELKKNVEDGQNYNNSLGIKQSRLQNELDFMKLRLQHFELNDEERLRNLDLEKRSNNLSERNAQYEQQRKTLKRVAKIFDCPVSASTNSNNVASLRKQFTENELRLSSNCSPKVSSFSLNQKGQLPKPLTQKNVLCRRPMKILSNNDTPNLKHSSKDSTEKSPKSTVSSDSSTSLQIQRRSKSTGMFYQNSPYRSNSVFHKVAEHN